MCIRDSFYAAAIAASCLELKDTLRGSPWDWIDWGLTIAGGSISAVSYTHLDVYKRQLPAVTVRFMNL